MNNGLLSETSSNNNEDAPLTDNSKAEQPPESLFEIYKIQLDRFKRLTKRLQVSKESWEHEKKMSQNLSRFSATNGKKSFDVGSRELRHLMREHTHNRFLAIQTAEEKMKKIIESLKSGIVNFNHLKRKEKNQLINNAKRDVIDYPNCSFCCIHEELYEKGQFLEQQDSTRYHSPTAPFSLIPYSTPATPLNLTTDPNFLFQKHNQQDADDKPNQINKTGVAPGIFLKPGLLAGANSISSSSFFVHTISSSFKTKQTSNLPKILNKTNQLKAEVENPFHSDVNSSDTQQPKPKKFACPKCEAVSYCCQEHLELDSMHHDKVCAFLKKINGSVAQFSIYRPEDSGDANNETSKTTESTESSKNNSPIQNTASPEERKKSLVALIENNSKISISTKKKLSMSFRKQKIGDGFEDDESNKEEEEDLQRSKEEEEDFAANCAEEREFQQIRVDETEMEMQRHQMQINLFVEEVDDQGKVKNRVAVVSPNSPSSPNDEEHQQPPVRKWSASNSNNVLRTRKLDPISDSPLQKDESYRKLEEKYKKLQQQFVKMNGQSQKTKMKLKNMKKEVGDLRNELIQVKKLHSDFLKTEVQSMLFKFNEFLKKTQKSTSFQG